jgi:hypothetical protein
MDPQKKKRERDNLLTSPFFIARVFRSVERDDRSITTKRGGGSAGLGWRPPRQAGGRVGSLSSSGTPRPGKFLGVAVAGPTGAAHAPAPRVAFVRLPCLSSRSSPWPWARADTDGRACARTAQRYEAAAVRRVGWFAEPSTRGHVWRVRSGSRRLGRSGTRAAVVPLHLAESRTRAHCASS